MPYAIEETVVGMSQHIADLGAFFARLKKHVLKVNLKKCYFVQPQVKVLGYVMSKE